MEGEVRERVTKALEDLQGGDGGAAERLLPLVYEELRGLAERHLRHERPGHTLQATALVHEAWLRLAGQDRVDWQGRTHFFAVGAEAMRRVLLDHARARGRQKRGGGFGRVTLAGLALEETAPGADADVLAEALETLDRLDPRQARIVRLRFFAGLTVDEVAEVTEISRRTVEREWTHARAWLRRELA